MAVALLARAFVVTAYAIPSGSMQQTLRIGDHIAVDRLAYAVSPPRRGDIVVFSGAGSWDAGASAEPPRGIVAHLQDVADRILGRNFGHGQIYVKRVIGIPGDRVECCDSRGRVKVNGRSLAEPYVGDDSQWNGSCSPDALSAAQDRCFGPEVVPPKMLWLMGDDRAISYDSRRHLRDPGGGFVPSDRVIGKAFAVVWPLSHSGTLGTPATFSSSRWPSPSVGVLAVAVMVTLGWLLRPRRTPKHRGRRTRWSALRRGGQRPGRHAAGRRAPEAPSVPAARSSPESDVGSLTR